MCYCGFVKKIGVLSKKGGVGKTLLAMGLAQVLSEKGRTAVYDLDPEGSATAWAMNAEKEGLTLPYEVITPVNAIELGAVDYLIYDTPPNDSKSLGETAKVCDVLVIPLKPGALEMDRLESTLKVLRSVKLKSEAQLGLFLNMMRADGVSRAMQEAIETLGFPVIGSAQTSVVYQRAFGGIIPELPENRKGKEYEALAPFRAALKEVDLL